MFPDMSVEEAYRDSIIRRDVTGEAENDFPPEWSLFFMELQKASGLVLFSAFRKFWYQYFLTELGQQVNISLLLQVCVQNRIYGAPDRALKHYKRALKPSFLMKLRKAWEMIKLAKAAKGMQ